MRLQAVRRSIEQNATGVDLSWALRRGGAPGPAAVKVIGEAILLRHRIVLGVVREGAPVTKVDGVVIILFFLRMSAARQELCVALTSQRCVLGSRWVNSFSPWRMAWLWAASACATAWALNIAARLPAIS